MSDINEEVDAFLAHYGVKGMKWGVINEDDGLNETDRAVREKLEPQGYTKDRVERQFGENPKKEKRRLTDDQKAAIKLGLGLAAAGGLAYYVHKKNAAFLKDLEENADFYHELMKMNELKSEGEIYGLTADAISKLSTQRLHLEPGSIVQRLSMTKETEIRDQFFACYDQADVARYKAILPTYWKQWGGGKNPTGFVVNLRANAAINAPSERETLDIFKSLFDQSFPFDREPTFRQFLQKATSADLDDDALAARYLPQFAGAWNNPGNPYTKAMFEKVKSMGYNAIPDMNDANNLANAPHIFLDGSLFEIVGHDVHGIEQIKAAQKEILALVHGLEDHMSHLTANEIDLIGNTLEHQGLTDDQIDNYFLEHQGVKGMKWGVRRAEKRAAKGPDRFGNRNNDVVQRRLDRVSRVASGTASGGDKVRALLFNIPPGLVLFEGGSVKGAAANMLERGAKTQRKINAGKRNVTDTLLRMQGMDIRELDYSYDKSN